MVLVSKIELEAILADACKKTETRKLQKAAKDHLTSHEFKNKADVKSLVKTCVRNALGKTIKLQDVKMVQDGVYRVTTATDVRKLFRMVNVDGRISRDVVDHIQTKVFKFQGECLDYMKALTKNATRRYDTTVKMSDVPTTSKSPLTGYKTSKSAIKLIVKSLFPDMVITGEATDYISKQSFPASDTSFQILRDAGRIAMNKNSKKITLLHFQEAQKLNNIFIKWNTQLKDKHTKP